MPIYEYKCPVCGAFADKLHKIDDTPEVLCPEDNTKMERAFSVPAFKFANGKGTDMGTLMSLPNPAFKNSRKEKTTNNK